MTILDMQDALVEEIKQLLQDRKYQKAFKPKERVEMTVYPQAVPLEFELDEISDEVIVSKAPYMVVRLREGNSGNNNTGDKVQVYITTCIYDNNFDQQGYRSLMEIVEVIKQRFMTNPILANQYVCNTEEIGWVLPDEDEFPFYFSMITMQFEIPAIRREDMFC